MKNRKLILLAAILNLISVICTAQEQSENRPPWEKNIETQFNYVIDKSSRYEDYKVIKSGWISTLRLHVLDTLKSVRQQLQETKAQVISKERTIDSLKSDLQTINDNLSTISKEKNSFRFLGILMPKYYYNSLMWSIIIGLFTLLLIFIMLYRRSNAVTTQTKLELAEAKEEFEAHRKRSREREERLARQYLDELNKIKSQSKKI